MSVQEEEEEAISWQCQCLALECITALLSAPGLRPISQSAPKLSSSSLSSSKELHILVQRPIAQKVFMTMAEESQGNCNKCPVYVIWERVREVRYLQLTGKLEDLLRTPNAQLYSPSVQTLPLYNT